MECGISRSIYSLLVLFMAIRRSGLCAGGTHKHRRNAVDKVLHYLPVHHVTGKTVVFKCPQATFLPTLVCLYRIFAGNFPALFPYQFKDIKLLLWRELFIVSIPAGKRLHSANEQVNVHHACGYVATLSSDIKGHGLPAVSRAAQIMILSHIITPSPKSFSAPFPSRARASCPP